MDINEAFEKWHKTSYPFHKENDIIDMGQKESRRKGFTAGYKEGRVDTLTNMLEEIKYAEDSNLRKPTIYLKSHVDTELKKAKSND